MSQCSDTLPTQSGTPTPTTTPSLPEHPAKFSGPLYPLFEEIVRRELASGAWQNRLHGPRAMRILDPFAGVGGCFNICRPEQESGAVRWIGWEIEYDWACQAVPSGDSEMMVLNSLTGMRALAFDGLTVDMVLTSPCYGNRMADHHNAKDDSERNTYRHKYGKELSEGTSATMQWGVDYRRFHRQCWEAVYDILDPGSVFVDNIKNHIRDGKEMLVSEWHRDTCLEIGFEMAKDYQVPVTSNRQGANGDLRVPFEHVYVFRKPE